MINAATPRTRSDTSIWVTPDGTVSYAERCKVTLSSKFAVAAFPFRSTVADDLHPSFFGGRPAH